MPLPVCCHTGRRASRRLILAGLAMLFLAGGPRKTAAAPADYLVDVWGTEKNLPDSSVTSIAQTPDGYLWVGTHDGLARFDGSRFVTFDYLSHARIQDLYVDATGTLWINTFRGGLTSFKNGVFRAEWPDQTVFDLRTALVSSSSNEVVFVTQFGTVLRRGVAATNSPWNVLEPPGDTRPIFQCVDRGGTLWFLTREGNILRVVDQAFATLADNGGLGKKRVYTLVTDPRGSLWAGAENEIARWNGSRFETMTPTNGEPVRQPAMIFPMRSGALWVLDGDRLRKEADRQWLDEAPEWRGLLGPASGRAMGAHEDRAGGVWFNHYGNGLFHVTPEGRHQRLTTRDGLLGDRIGAWLQGRDGGIWLGMDRGGLARLHDRRFQVIGRAEGLTARAAFSVCEDSAGAVWIGTAGGGLCRWQGEKITPFAAGSNAAANFVFSVFPRLDGALWLSAEEGEELFDFRDGRLQRPPWDVHGVKSILTDHSGRLWLGTKSGVSWWSAAASHLFDTNAGLTLSAVRALAEGPDGTVWCGADDGALYRCEPDRVFAFRPKDALAGQPIWSLLADSAGVVWAGTFRGGLLRFEGGIFTRFTAHEGLPVDLVSQILEDNRGRLWLGTHQGIYRVAKAQLNAVASHKANSVDCVAYGTFDGLPTLECSDGYQPACWRGRDGRLWFTTSAGVVSVDPAALTANSVAPPVIIEEMRVDDQSLPLGAPKLIVGPGHHQFEFRFTALNFDAPDKTRFRYRIDGLDTDWVDADQKRPTADYWHLPPNDYRFRVTACNGDGIWNQTAAVVVFGVRPYWYQEWWFRALTLAAVLAAVVAGARAASARKYQRDLARLEQRHAIERDRARIAKDIHDDIGAGLTQITLLSELARREPQQSAIHLDRISKSARQLTRAMDEIVWAVDPQHDTFSGLMDYASAFAEDFLRTAGIRCRMDMPISLPAVRMDTELRYNLFLALKEALNNTVKHSHATEVWLRLLVQPDAVTLVVEDNGQGLTPAANGGAAPENGRRIASGSGLVNLEARLAAIGGRCLVVSTPGQGTRVEMRLPITPQSSIPNPQSAIGGAA